MGLPLNSFYLLRGHNYDICSLAVHTGSVLQAKNNQRHCEEGRREVKKSDVIARSAATRQPPNDLTNPSRGCFALLAMTLVYLRFAAEPSSQ